jgi:uncharacterized membrane protein
MRVRYRHTALADLVSLGLVALGLGLSALLYPRLPAQVPVHFTLEGVPDGWASRPVGALLAPGLALGQWWVLRHGGTVLPGRTRAALARSPVHVVALLGVGLLTALHLCVLYSALGGSRAVGTPMALAVGVFCVLAGQVLPRLRRNPLAGFRTPWALLSDEAWQRTQRFGGYALTLGGLAVLALAPFSLRAARAALLVACVAPAIHSFLLALPSRGRQESP